jgi:hypothetical protein
VIVVCPDCQKKYQQNQQPEPYFVENKGIGWIFSCFFCNSEFFYLHSPISENKVRKLTILKKILLIILKKILKFLNNILYWIHFLKQISKKLKFFNQIDFIKVKNWTLKEKNLYKLIFIIFLPGAFIYFCFSVYKINTRTALTLQNIKWEIKKEYEPYAMRIFGEIVNPDEKVYRMNENLDLTRQDLWITAYRDCSTTDTEKVIYNDKPYCAINRWIHVFDKNFLLPKERQSFDLTFELQKNPNPNKAIDITHVDVTLK